MGTMVQQAGLCWPADAVTEGGCIEALNLTQPAAIELIHQAYLAVGVDAVTTNSFGAHPAALAEYGLADQTEQLNQAAAQLARTAVKAAARPGTAGLVLGSMGPGSKLPSLGHITFAELRHGYARQAAGLLAGGADRLLIETCQDPLQAKAAVLGARDASAKAHLTVHFTVEASGTMLLGTETLAALTTLAALGIDGIGLNCATGPEEMSEHLRTLARSTELPISVMPNAGLPTIGPDGQAVYDLTPKALADWLELFASEYGAAMVGGCCGTTPDHLAEVVARLGGQAVRQPAAVGHTARRSTAGQVASLYQAVALRQQTAYLAVGERTNANGSKVFRTAMLAGDTDGCVTLARDQAAAGAHLLDLSVDYVGRNGVADMTALSSALTRAVALPLMIDSTEPAVIQAALENHGGRAVVNSVNYEAGAGPGSRFAQIMALVRAHGAAVVGLAIDEQGQARSTDHKVAVARRLMAQLTGEYGLDVADILIDSLTFPIGTGQAETRQDALATLEALATIRAEFPGVNLLLGVSNVSFGLSPAARVVLNSVFLDEAIKAGLSAAIIRPGGIRPLAGLDPDLVQVAVDLIYDRRREGYDPLTALLERCQDQITDLETAGSALTDLPLTERIAARVVQGAPDGLAEDLNAALANGYQPQELIDQTLLGAMAQVGQLFGAGRMQLPFVLRSAEVMKQAVDLLEPHLPGAGAATKGTVVLATVAGDVHDIGKNLVDIILSNNGYRVVNLGVKQSIGQILAAAERHQAMAIGLSGLLVKSTQVMRDNLAEMNLRGVARRWPVILGGAALTRGFVEDDLSAMFDGQVYYAKDALETLNLVNRLAAGSVEATAEANQAQPGGASSVSRGVAPGGEASGQEGRSPYIQAAPVPPPPFWGSRVTKGVRLADFEPLVDPRALFIGQWGLKAGTGERSVDQLIAEEGWPRYRALMDQVRSQGLVTAGIVHGYFPVRANGESLSVLDPVDQSTEVGRWHFPRQTDRKGLALTDFFAPDRTDVLALQAVTVGPGISAAGQDLFKAGHFREYVELNGLGAALAEALAQYFHDRIRQEWSLAAGQGTRFSLGYPACPDVKGRALIARLLRIERIGLELTDGYLLDPPHSTEALVIHHPQATYFSVRPGGPKATP